jgi:hypothetical protein
MIGIRSAFSIRARGHRPHLEAVYMTAPRSVCRNTKKALPTGGRPYMTTERACAPSSSLRANGSRECAPMTGSAKQSTKSRHIRCHTQRRRGIQYAAASRLIVSACGILDHPLSRMMTTECVATDFQTANCIPAAWRARVMHECFRPKREGVGNAGRPMHPQSRVRNGSKHTR